MLALPSYIFQSPFNRDSNCNDFVDAGVPIGVATFSPLLIGIAIVTLAAIKLGEYWRGLSVPF